MFLASSNSGAARVNDGVVQDRWTESDAARFYLWVDGVGGYLVCLSPQVTLGQAIPGVAIDVPILGDVSRRHLTLHRDADRYVLDPLQEVSVNDRPCLNKTVLNDNDELDLGSGVRVRFRQPHPLSASARLEFLSRHRLQSAADGVLLMAESCVLGPSWKNHVVCRDWRHDLVLYRRDGGMYCRSGGDIEVDGQPCRGQSAVRCGSRIDGEDFSLSLEQA